MLSSDEQKCILEQLPFANIPPFEAEFIKTLYISKLNSFETCKISYNAHQELLDTYNLSKSPLVLISKAQVAMAQFNYEKALQILNRYDHS